MPRDKLVTIFEIALVAILPTLLLIIRIFPTSNRIAVYGLFYALVIPISFVRHLPFKALFSYENFRQATPRFLPFVLITIIIGIGLAWGINYRININAKAQISPLIYLGISIPVQQLVFFGYLYLQMTKITENKTLIMLAVALCYSGSHLPWGNVMFTGLTLGLGLVWAKFYVNSPSLPWSIISHLVVGIFSLVLIVFQ